MFIIKRDLNRRPMYEYRCDERLNVKAEGSTLLVYTGLLGGPKNRDEVNRPEVCECDG